MTKSNQSKKHEMMNARNESVLISRGWVSRFEELHTDIAAFLPGCNGVWAVESELRGNAYWIRRNAMRNERNGAYGIVFVTESEAVAVKVRKIVSSLPDSVKKKTVVVTADNFTPGFVKTVMEGRS